MLDPSRMRFTADRMLGRLAKMLRLLGYDTAYSTDLTSAQLEEISRREERVLLTRGSPEKRFPAVQKVFSLKSEYPAEQLREVVQRFALDTRGGLWTRCTLCNAQIQKVEKRTVESLVEPKVYQVYEEFFRCSGCGHIYWQGSHVERILQNLASLLGESDG